MQRDRLRWWMAWVLALVVLRATTAAAENAKVTVRCSGIPTQAVMCATSAQTLTMNCTLEPPSNVPTWPLDAQNLDVTLALESGEAAARFVGGTIANGIALSGPETWKASVPLASAGDGQLTLHPQLRFSCPARAAAPTQNVTAETDVIVRIPRISRVQCASRQPVACVTPPTVAESALECRAPDGMTVDDDLAQTRAFLLCFDAIDVAAQPAAPRVRVQVGPQSDSAPLVILGASGPTDAGTTCWQIPFGRHWPQLRRGQSIVVTRVEQHVRCGTTDGTTRLASFVRDAPPPGPRCTDRAEFPGDDDLAALTQAHQSLCASMHHPCENGVETLPTTTGLYGGGAAYFDRLVLVYGPDGRLRGSVPRSIPEHVPTFALVYHRANANYRFHVEGCAEPPFRVNGVSINNRNAAATTRAAAPEVNPPDQLTDWAVSWTRVNRCSADTDVTVHLTLPAQGDYCAAHEEAVRFRTEPITYLGVTVAGVLNLGRRVESGVTPGLGGNPSRLYQRDELAEFRPVVGVLVFPGGIPTSTAVPFFQRLGIGTAVELTLPFADFNVLGALCVLPGINILAGMRLARYSTFLDHGFMNGDVYVGDSAQAPLVRRWEAAPAFSVGLSIDQQVVTALIKGR